MPSEEYNDYCAIMDDIYILDPSGADADITFVDDITLMVDKDGWEHPIFIRLAD